MGFFSNLTGGASRRDAKKATADANALLNTGMDRALGELGQGTGQQLASLEGGYTKARGGMEDALARALAALQGGATTARGDLETGAGRAEGAINDALARTNQVLDPYLQAGGKAQGLYDTALGVNGTDAAGDFYQQYADNDPFRQFNEDMANRGIQRAANASGQFGSGRTATAMSRASLERGSADLNRYLDRLKEQAGMGTQVAGQLAGYSNQAGTNVANLRNGLGQNLANVATGLGTASANANMQSGQQLGALDYGYGTDKGGIEAGQAGNRANLIYGNAQQQAGNRIGLGNALASTRSTGLNNLFQLGSLAIGAMTPGRYGTSAAGNLASGMTNLFK